MKRALIITFGTLIGFFLTVGWVLIPQLRENNLGFIGPIVGITLIVFSLFGELPFWISWAQKMGQALYPGVLIGTLFLLLPLFSPTTTHESSFFAISPTVWAAYLSIVVVGISFEASTLPESIYNACKKLAIKPYLLIPVYVCIAGLLGNILDGVSIVIISTIILFRLLDRQWATQALFALLFGGLISNLITVAAEPTNIKFQDVLAPLLNKLHPTFWVTNWPICILGILFPTLYLSILFARNRVSWQKEETSEIKILPRAHHIKTTINKITALLAMLLLAGGVIVHAILGNIPSAPIIPLWQLLLPAGIIAIIHLFGVNELEAAGEHILEQSPVWIKIAVIFSLLWYLQFGLSSSTHSHGFFTILPHQLQLFFLILLSLASSVTDNVALAAMQGTILINNVYAIWEIRLLLILLTWAGGLTSFGCLQSLSINHRLKLSTTHWIKQTPVWAFLSLTGGLVGLVLTILLYK